MLEVVDKFFSMYIYYKFYPAYEDYKKAMQDIIVELASKLSQKYKNEVSIARLKELLINIENFVYFKVENNSARKTFDYDDIEMERFFLREDVKKFLIGEINIIRGKSGFILNLWKN